ncbi:MAG: sigma factor-like helix-turn-helix DNA-binding protein [Sporolactobacillus sp.]
MSLRKLMYEYKQTLRDLKAAYEAADPDEDKPIIGGMISDLEYAIRWMETGRDPERWHMDAERTRVYMTDPAVIDAVQHDVLNKDPHGPISQVDRERIEDSLCELTRREKEVYILAKVELFSYGEIAELLEMSKGSVQSYMDRSINKIECRKKESLFLI